MVFTLADADIHDWRSRAATTLRGGVPAGPIVGFEAKDAPASASLADLRSGLDESWRSGEDASSRFKMFRELADESRAAWLGFVVARSEDTSELQSLMRISYAVFCLKKKKERVY